MLVETVVQCVGQMLIEMAIREVAMPAAKKLAQNASAQRQGRVADSAAADATVAAPLLSPVRAIRVVSAIPGRLRVDIAGLTGQAELARKLDEEIGALGGVTQAAASVRTGRMLVIFAPDLQTADGLVAAIDRGIL